jgi:hypothetical protein
MELNLPALPALERLRCVVDETMAESGLKSVAALPRRAMIAPEPIYFRPEETIQGFLRLAERCLSAC